MNNMQIEKLLEQCPLKKSEIFEYVLNKGLLADSRERAKKRLAIAFNKLYKDFTAEQKPAESLVKEYQEALNDLMNLIQEKSSGLDALL